MAHRSGASPPVSPSDDVGASSRITFLLSGLTVGGAERHTLDLARDLESRGFKTTVIALGRRSSGACKLERGQAVTGLGARRVLGVWSWPRVAKAVRDTRPDVVVAVNQATALVLCALRAVGAVRASTVCVFHTTVPLPRERPHLAVLRRVADRFDSFVFVSANQARWWKARGLAPRHGVVVRNGVALDRFQLPSPSEHAAAKVRLGLAPDTPVIGLLGAFRPEKNHRQLVAALPRLAPSCARAVLVFVGDGGGREAVVAQVAELGLEDRVVFAGEHADVRPFVAAFDLGVLCSTAVETFSLAALEILAMGVPMIMSDTGGASEIVVPGVNGVLFPPGDLDALVASLVQTLEPTTLADLQLQARASVERFAMPLMVDAYSSLLRSLALR